MSGTTVNANVVIPFPFEFPYLVDNANGVNFELFILKYQTMPQWGQINGLTLRFDVSDDGFSDRQQSFKLLFTFPGPNLEVLTFTDNLGHNIGAFDPLDSGEPFSDLLPALLLGDSSDRGAFS
jgi:hypothetical protein